MKRERGKKSFSNTKITPKISGKNCLVCVSPSTMTKVVEHKNMIARRLWCMCVQTIKYYCIKFTATNQIDCPFTMQSAILFFTFFFVCRSEFYCLKFEFQIRKEIITTMLRVEKRLKCLWVCWIFNHSKTNSVFHSCCCCCLSNKRLNKKIYAILYTQTIIFGKFPSIIVNNTELLKAPTPPQFNDNSIKFDGNKVPETHNA